MAQHQFPAEGVEQRRESLPLRKQAAVQRAAVHSQLACHLLGRTAAARQQCNDQLPAGRLHAFAPAAQRLLQMASRKARNARALRLAAFAQQLQIRQAADHAVERLVKQRGHAEEGT
ncbi:conserved hypothetical protein, partial [Ricinus communis]